MCVYIVFIFSKETKETTIKEKERKEKECVREGEREREYGVCACISVFLILWHRWSTLVYFNFVSQI